MIFVAIVLGGALVVVWLLAYAAGVWFLGAHHLVDLSDPKAIAALLPLIPPIMATVATIATAGTTVVVALINRRAQTDLASIQSRYSKELEEKKKLLSIELEQEKAQLDVFKSDMNRLLQLVGRASLTLSEYAASLRKLRRGVFDEENIEVKEQEVRAIAIEWARESSLYTAWYKLLSNGVYLKERAEQRSTSDGWKKLWSEVLDGKRLGVRFGELQEHVVIELRQERERILNTKRS
jgi:hypothetical protein